MIGEACSDPWWPGVTSVMLGIALGVPQRSVVARDRIRTRLAALYFFGFVWGTILVWNVLLSLSVV